MKLVAYQAQLGDLHGVTSHQYTFNIDDVDFLEIKDYLDDEGAVLRSFIRKQGNEVWVESPVPVGVEEQIELFWNKSNPLKDNLHLLKEMDIFINIIN